MSDQEKHLAQSSSPEEVKAIHGAQNAAKNAHTDPAAAPVPAGKDRPAPRNPSSELAE